MLAAVGGVGLTAIGVAVQSLYRVGGEFNSFIDKHIDEMKQSDKPTIARTGAVLEAAKFGFGIGYVVPVGIIAAGQLLLGSTLSAVVTVTSAATLTNPIAMTCAAIGAIYYGWNALSDEEKNEALAKLSHGLEVGVEMIRSMINFVIRVTGELLSSEQIDELKKFVSDGAKAFGRTLSDVTKKLKDILSDAYTTVAAAAEEAGDKVIVAAQEAKKAAGVALEKTTAAAGEAANTASTAANHAVDAVKDKLAKK